MTGQVQARWRTLLAGVVLVAAGAAAYSNSLDGAWVFDDRPSILLNRTILTLWPMTVPLSPPGAGATVQGRPIVNLSLAVCYAIGGQNVRVFHAFNITVHLLTGLVLLGIVRRTLLAPPLRGRFERSAGPLALGVALLWTLHPLQTSAVTYIIQRAESMMGLFYLLTLYAVIRGAGSARPWAWYAAAIASCALGMGCKEVMASVPAMVLLYDRAFLAGSFRLALRRRWGLYAGLAGTWGVLAGLVLPGWGRGGTVGFGGGISSVSYAKTQCWAILHYLRLSFWPDALVLDYGTPLVTDLPGALPGAVVLTALLAATLAALLRWARWGFLGAWFFLILAPSSSFIPVVTERAAEHRMYLPLAAVVAGAVIGLFLLGRRLAGRTGWARGARVLGALLVLSSAAALGYATWRRNLDYRSDVAIWRDATRRCPKNARAFHNLGMALMYRHEHREAVEAFTQAIRLDDRYDDACNNRAVAYGYLGRNDLALADLDRAIELNPGNPYHRANRARLLANLGRYDQALRDLADAIDRKPDEPEFYFARANSLSALNRYREAIADFTRALDLDPGQTLALYNRGNAHAALGEMEAAVADYTRALEHQEDADFYNNRGAAYYSLGRYRLALQDLDRALEMSGGRNPDMRLTRGLVLMRMGRYDLAAQDFTAVIRQQAENPDAYLGRAAAYYCLGRVDEARADAAAGRTLGAPSDAEFLKILSEAARPAQSTTRPSGRERPQ